ncbi:MAG: response regulator [Desulfobulbaceae bacterium]|nr:response regulator [Desulfobulbaceae bacterium]
MSSISLFPCKFSVNSGFIAELSHRLDLSIYTDKELFEDVTERFGGDKEKLKKMMYSKTSVFNQFTLEKEKSINMFRTVLAEKLLSGDRYLFYGLHSMLIPESVSEVLRVIVVDSKEGRMDRGIGERISKSEVKRQIKQHDISAFEWTDFLFAKEAYDSSLYDLVLLVNRSAKSELVEKIVKYYQKTSVLRTLESQRRVKDMSVAAEVENQLLKDGHKVGIDVVDGKVALTVKDSVFNFNGLAASLIRQAMEINGVVSVDVNRVKTYEDSVYRQQKFELPSKVLFVDDEREFVQTVSNRLNSRNVGTYGVYSGEEALTLIPEDKPDVMVLDLKMIGLQGTEVLRRTKELAPEIEVIILTGHGSMQDEKECMELGAFAYLNKPVDIEQLSETIKAANDKAHEKFPALKRAS